MRYLTNAHTHLELTPLKNLCPKEPMPFFYWLHRRLVPKLFFRCRRKIQIGIADGIHMLKAYGTTHVYDITATWLSVAPLMKSGLCGIVFLEVLGNHPDRAMARLEKAKQYIRSYRNQGGLMRIGLSLHAPYTCHRELLRRGARWCREESIPLCIHAAESPDEIAWLSSGKAPQIPWHHKLIMKLLGVNFTPPYMRPIPYLDTLGVLDASPLLVHAVNVTREEIKMIKDSGSRVVHCPRSNYLLANGRMPLQAFLDTGVDVYMGTDSLASSPDLDIRRESEFAAKIHSGEISPLVLEQLISKPIY